MKIVLQGLTKRYPNRNKRIKTEVVAVDDFTFEIPDGKLVGLLGPSGCGKSTILNLISGLVEPTSGKVFFGDEDVTDVPAEKRGVGLVFQNYALYPHLTVLQNIIFPLQNIKGPSRPTKEEMNSRATQAAKLVQIEDLMDRRPGELSGGQQQRVAIARAIVKKPGVLLLDEPLSNLDARLRLQTREEIKRIQRETGITTVFVTHDQEEAMSISDLVVVMRQAKLCQSGRAQDIYDDPADLFVAKFLGTPPINVFEGEIKGGRLYIANEAILDAPGVPDASVTVGIRPEGLIPSESGTLTCGMTSVEVMGRDTGVVFTHPSLDGGAGRAIVDSDAVAGLEGKDAVRFSVKPKKVCIFDRVSEKRIRFDTDAR